MTETGPTTPARVRVTGADPRTSSRAPVPLPGATDADTVYARSLIRAQLRLALGCLLGVVVCALAFALVMLTVPALGEIALFGVPLPWLMHAYGFYPIIAAFALIYVRSATRNERRYRTLREAGG